MNTLMTTECNSSLWIGSQVESDHDDQSSISNGAMISQPSGSIVYFDNAKVSSQEESKMDSSESD